VWGKLAEKLHCHSVWVEKEEDGMRKVVKFSNLVVGSAGIIGLQK
jgi:hypothetical protein